jgi:hypothetical protein
LFFAVITPSAQACKSIITNAVDIGIAGILNICDCGQKQTCMRLASFYRESLSSLNEKDQEIAHAITGMGIIW